MPQLDGKQLKDGTVAEAKAATAWSAELVKRDGSVAMTGNFNGGSQRYINLGAPSAASDAARLQDIQNIPWKESCRCASTANVDESTGGLLTIDDIGPLTAGDRVLLKNQSDDTENGIYVAAVGAWSRAADNDSTEEMQGAVVNINEGTLNADTRWAQTEDDVTVGSDTVTWVNIGGAAAPSYPVSSNKEMTASVGSGNYQLATVTTMAATPSGNGYVMVFINGHMVVVGDGVRTKECYFSSDSGASARSIAAIAAGDECYWNGTIAGYDLAASDIVDFYYLNTV